MRSMCWSDQFRQCFSFCLPELRSSLARSLPVTLVLACRSIASSLCRVSQCPSAVTFTGCRIDYADAGAHARTRTRASTHTAPLQLWAKESRLLPSKVEKLGTTVRHRGMGTGISEASKRVPIFSFATQGGKQVSSHFRQGN